MNELLSNLNGVLKKTSLQDLQAINQLFEKSHMWNRLGAEHLKVLLWLHKQDSGAYDVRTISEAVAVKDTKGEPWPGPVQIERILVNLEDAGFIRVWWAERMGIRTNHPFKVECDKLYHEWGLTGDFWKNLGEAVQSASYRDLQALQRIYKETSLLKQPAFFLRVLTWAATNGAGTVTEAELREEFRDIYQEVKFAFDGRNPEDALRWFQEKGLLNVSRGEPAEPIHIDTEPLTKWGFAIGGAE